MSFNLQTTGTSTGTKVLQRGAPCLPPVRAAFLLVLDCLGFLLCCLLKCLFSLLMCRWCRACCCCCSPWLLSAPLPLCTLLSSCNA